MSAMNSLQNFNTHLLLGLKTSTVNSCLADTPLLQTPPITDIIQHPGESYRGLTENDSCLLHNLAIVELQTLL